MVVEYNNEISAITKKLTNALYKDRNLAKVYEAIPALVRAINGYIHFNALFMKEDPTKSRENEEKRNLYNHYSLYQIIYNITPEDELTDLLYEYAKVMRSYNLKGEYSPRGWPKDHTNKLIVEGFSIFCKDRADG